MIGNTLHIKITESMARPAHPHPYWEQKPDNHLEWPNYCLVLL